jgi:hypothetical protein
MLQLFYPFINRVISTVIEFILGIFHIGTIFDVLVVGTIYASFKLSEFGCETTFFWWPPNFPLCPAVRFSANMKTTKHKLYCCINYSIYKRVEQLKHRSGWFLSSVHVVFSCENGLRLKLMRGNCISSFVPPNSLKFWWCTIVKVHLISGGILYEKCILYANFYGSAEFVVKLSCLSPIADVDISKEQKHCKRRTLTDWKFSN